MFLFEFLGANNSFEGIWFEEGIIDGNYINDDTGDTWCGYLTTDLFGLSRTTGLNFLQIFFTFSCFIELPKILNKANSRNKISFSPRLKSATL